MAWMILLLSSNRCLFAQQQPYNQLTITDGLSQGMVYDILQDKQGFIWIATKDGLNRYDAYGFELFSHSPSDSTSISDDIVTALMEDSFGRIWVGTENGGLNIFDPKMEAFYHLTPQANNLSANHINMIVQENDSIFWVATRKGLDRVTLPKRLALSPLTQKSLDTSVSIQNFFVEGVDPVVQELLIIDGKELLAAANQRVYTLSLDAPTQLRPAQALLNLPVLRQPNSYYNLNQNPNGSLSFTGMDTIYIKETGRLRKIASPGQSRNIWHSTHIDQQGNIWAGVFNRLYKIAPGQSEATFIVAFEKNWLQTVLFTDQNGLVWVGSNGYGIRIFNPRVTRFNHQVVGRSTRQIQFDPAGRQWVWHNREMRVWNPTTRSLYYPEGFPEAGKHSNFMLNTPDGAYWFRNNIIEEGQKLIRYSPETAKVTYYPYSCHTPPYVPVTNDKDGRIWMPCNNSTIALLYPEQDTMQWLDLTGVFPEGYTDLEFSDFLYMEEEDAFWAGTQHGLIYLKLQPNGKLTSKYFKYTPGAAYNPISDNILCIAPAQDNQLWVGTRGGGFSLFNPQNGHFTNYTREEGLPNEVVYGILKDENGKLWMSTNRGIACFDPTTETFRNFTARDGLQADEFNSASYTKAPDGKLYFGGVNGISSFYPEKVQEGMASPAVKITRIDINNKQLDFKKSPIVDCPIHQLQSLNLTHDQNALTLYFTALQFANPNKHRYRYQLEGVDEEPVTVQGKREVTYANLSPGQYTFKVWGSSQGGQWSETPTTLNISISPPWWQSSLAYLLYTLSFLGAVYLIYRFQIRRATLRNQLAYEQREAERLVELGRLKSDFFSNITHEFRTPLTLIQEPARQLTKRLKAEEERSLAYLVSKNSQRLLKLVNQLLDISKIEGGAMPMHYETGNLANFLQQWTAQYQKLADERQIELHYTYEGSITDYFGEFDTDKLEKITNNLLSNAFKFTPENGRIAVRACRMGHHFQLQVQDNGAGIPESDQAKIFERFYQSPSNPTSGGTGIGLSLCKELTTLMDGDLSLDSSMGKGSTFTLLLPIRAAEVNPTPSTAVSAAASLPTAPANPTTSKLEVLLVEDNPELRGFVRSILKDNYHITEAENGRDGLLLATEELPDLVISDVMMPIMDGFELTQRLKQDERTSHIPVVLLTAKSAIESRLEGLSYGADAYLDKPFHSEELIIRVEQLIRTRQLLQEKYSQAKGDNQPDLPKAELQFINKLEDSLEQNLSDTTLNAETLAKYNHLSRSQLHRKLKAVTGLSTTAFIRKYRLQRGREMLIEGLSVSEVSLKVGFNSPQYFSTRFKEHFGHSPSDHLPDPAQ
jgi:signal transduction histidine kinase/DNA-binding response OmpR family regulator/ligand-binding sensor domain-containing protein